MTVFKDIPQIKDFSVMQFAPQIHIKIEKLSLEDRVSIDKIFTELMYFMKRFEKNNKE